MIEMRAGNQTVTLTDIGVEGDPGGPDWSIKGKTSDEGLSQLSRWKDKGQVIEIRFPGDVAKLATIRTTHTRYGGENNSTVTVYLALPKSTS